jgi:hypothetical protein
LVKENLSERIVIERLQISLEELEEENKEFFTEFNENQEFYKRSAAEDEQRIKEYNDEINDLILEKEDYQKQVDAYKKNMLDEKTSNQNEVSQIKIKNGKELNDLDLEKTKLESDLQNKGEDIKR